MNLYTDAMNEGVMTTFFEMTFIEVIPLHEYSEIFFSADYSIYRIRNTSPEAMELTLRLPQNLHRIILKNIYPFEHSLDLQQRDDCILELINIIAGRFFSLYFKNQPYDMELPRVEFNSSTNAEGLSFAYNAEGIPFLISLRTS